MKSRLAAAALILCLAGGCTAITVATLPEAAPGGRRILVTSGGVSQPHQSLGLIQVYRSGFYWFAWIPISQFELDDTLNGYLLPEAERRGADAVINVRFHQTQYTRATHIIMTIPPLFLIPLPASTTISGELVKFTAAPPQRL